VKKLLVIFIIIGFSCHNQQKKLSDIISSKTVAAIDSPTPKTIIKIDTTLFINMDTLTISVSESNTFNTVKKISMKSLAIFQGFMTSYPKAR
jgi:hypothetical protein